VRQNLEADRRRLREEVVAALAPKGKAKGEGSLAKELGDLSRAVAGLAAKIQKLEAKLQGGADEQVLGKIDDAFARMTARLDRALPGQGPSAPPRKEEKPAAKAEAPSRPAAPSTPVSLRTVLRDAYDKLRCFREFQDGLVEIPRLYHEARRAIPNLSVAAFHQELQALWSRREVQLHVLNEVQSASEPDKGIRHNDMLYYYLYWTQS
jgi:hypothetical protein